MEGLRARGAPGGGSAQAELARGARRPNRDGPARSAQAGSNYAAAADAGYQGLAQGQAVSGQARGSEALAQLSATLPIEVRELPEVRSGRSGSSRQGSGRSAPYEDRR